MNGAQSLLKALIASGVEVCFANPGTSEMHLVAAMDNINGMRPVLVLFEGVATGAADGYGRMAGKPAVTLLHLGPGLSNGMANLHNARRARTPIVNLIGDHASYHLQYDSPLTADIVGQARTVSDWVKVNASAESLGADALAAILAAQHGAGMIASLVVPANHAWEAASGDVAVKVPPAPKKVAPQLIAQAAEKIRSANNVAILLGGKALREDALYAAGRIAAASGARILCETFPARWQRGAGRFMPERIPYLAEMAIDRLSEVDTLILVGATEPVAFFAYPNVPGKLCAETCEMVPLADAHADLNDVLQTLAQHLDAPETIATQARHNLPAPGGQLCAAGVGAVISKLMPDNTIISEEAATSSFGFYPMTEGAAKHEILSLTGGSIGQGLPVAVGAALACPDRKVICLHGDGGAMYTMQSLWTLAREKLDVTVIIYNNSSYAILELELARVGAHGDGDRARSLLNLNNPGLNWVALAQGMGISAYAADTVSEFEQQFAKAMRQRGPVLLEARIQPLNINNILGDRA